MYASSMLPDPLHPEALERRFRELHDDHEIIAFIRPSRPATPGSPTIPFRASAHGSAAAGRLKGISHKNHCRHTASYDPTYGYVSLVHRRQRTCDRALCGRVRTVAAGSGA